jgi:hypothetical protein
MSVEVMNTKTKSPTAKGVDEVYTLNKFKQIAPDRSGLKTPDGLN